MKVNQKIRPLSIGFIRVESTPLIHTVKPLGCRQFGLCFSHEYEVALGRIIIFDRSYFIER